MKNETCELCGKDFPTKEIDLVAYICNGCKDDKIVDVEDYSELYGNEEQAKESGTYKGNQREGICDCGYPCVYGTDYCERHQIP